MGSLLFLELRRFALNRMGTRYKKGLDCVIILYTWKNADYFLIKRVRKLLGTTKLVFHVLSFCALLLGVIKASFSRYVSGKL